jgi:chromosome segregation and condensation protein ScpB
MTEIQKIIQLCLHEGGPVKKSLFDNLQKSTSETILEVKTLLTPLGLELVENKDSIEICLSPEINQGISKQRFDDLKTELSESSLQTLTVILYKPGATKPEIDFVRGVDSVRSIKSLMTRGLIEKDFQKNKNQYHPSTETLKFLGLNTVENLPDYPEISAKLISLING